MLGLLIISSLLISSSLANILSGFFIDNLSLNFFTGEMTSQVPGFSQELGMQKSFDLTSFGLFVIISSGLVSINYLVSHKKDLNKSPSIYVYFGGSLLIYIQTFFVFHSGSFILIATVLLQLLFFSFLAFNKQLSKPSVLTMQNGIFAGFFALIVINPFASTFVLPFGVLLLLPVIYSLVNNTFTEHPAHLILVLVAFFPFNNLAKLIIVVLFFLLQVAWKPKSKKWIQKLNPYALLFLITYNPIFYFGTLDTIEEGFWLSWLQRSIEGKTIYKDFHAYHPPILYWGLNIFTRISEATVYHFRLYLHILQIIGVMIMYKVLNVLIDKKIIKLMIMFLILSVLVINVRNNVEIRLGLGLLATLPIYNFIKSKDYYKLLLSGVACSVALFSSLEIGVAVIISSLISLGLLSVILKLNTVKTYFYYLAGLSVSSLLVSIPMIVSGSLIEYFTQMKYVSLIFSSGYRNIVVSLPELSTQIQWHIVNNFFNSTEFLWEATKMSIIGSLLFVLLKVIKKEGNLKIYYVGVLSIFGLILFRPILGRSDVYHLLSVLILALIFIGYWLEKLNMKVKNIGMVALFLIALFFLRDQTQNNYLQNLVTKLQIYGTPGGDYPGYENQRLKILANIDVDTKIEDEMYKFIRSNTSRTDSIFVFPQRAEIYFLTNRKNATSYDTPLIYFTSKHQGQMISELKANNPKLIIYNPDINYSGLDSKSLKLVDEYIKKDYEVLKSFDGWQILRKM